MKVLFLYSELAGYFLAGVRALVRQHNVEAHIVYWPVHADAPFRFHDTDGIVFHDRAGKSYHELLSLARQLDPAAVYLPGWMDRDYLGVGSRLRRNGCPVICGMDTRWRGSLRQRVAARALGPALRRSASHAWVTGPQQYEYARRLGFSPTQILTGMYSADVDLFHEARRYRREAEAGGTKTLLYVGRLVEVKGILPLYEAFHEVARSSKPAWRLRIVGTGPLWDQLPVSDLCDVEGFVQPEELPELLGSADAFVLPSRREPWGVALHEAAAAGLPLLASDACGATAAFLREGYNGYGFPAGSRSALVASLRRLMQLSDSELALMGERSHELSRQITPQSWAATLFTVMRERQQ